MNPFRDLSCSTNLQFLEVENVLQKFQCPYDRQYKEKLGIRTNQVRTMNQLELCVIFSNFRGERMDLSFCLNATRRLSQQICDALCAKTQIIVENLGLSKPSSAHKLAIYRLTNVTNDLSCKNRKSLADRECNASYGRVAPDQPADIDSRRVSVVTDWRLLSDRFFQYGVRLTECCPDKIVWPKRNKTDFFDKTGGVLISQPLRGRTL